MKRDEIRDLALSELVQRSFRLMRENDPEANKAFTERTEIAGRMDEYISLQYGKYGQMSRKDARKKGRSKLKKPPFVGRILQRACSSRSAVRRRESR